MSTRGLWRMVKLRKTLIDLCNSDRPSSTAAWLLRKGAAKEHHGDTLVARAQVLATRRLLPKPTEDEQVLVQAMKKEARLAQNKPDRVKRRQAYFAALARHAGGKRRCDPRMPTPRTLALVYSGLWNKKGASERGVSEKEADRMAICRTKNISDALDEVQDETLELCRRIAGRLADRLQISMTEAAFTIEMLARCKMELTTFQPSKRDVAVVRKKVVDVPSRPSHASCEKLLAAGDFACDATDQPRWVAEVAARRQSFANTAFVVDCGSEGVSMWKFVYAIQTPVCVELCRMVELPHYYEQRGVTPSTWGLLSEHGFCKNFQRQFRGHGLADLCDVELCMPALL